MWAWMGQCLGKRSLAILKMCPLACGVCLPEGTSNIKSVFFLQSTIIFDRIVQAPNDSSTATCQDRHQKCHTWATRGRCFYQHIIRLCPSSCQKCPTSSKNKFLGRSFCIIFSILFTFLDPQEAPRPDTDRCRDLHNNCPHWQQRGFCNQAEYKQKCPMSCRVCLRNAFYP